MDQALKAMQMGTISPRPLRQQDTKQDETAKQIDPDLNVIVITGYPDREILDRILQVCPVMVLKKPLKIELALSDG